MEAAFSHADTPGPGGARRPEFKFGVVWEHTPGNRHLHVYTKVSMRPGAVDLIGLFCTYDHNCGSAINAFGRSGYDVEFDRARVCWCVVVRRHGSCNANTSLARDERIKMCYHGRVHLDVVTLDMDTAIVT